MRTGSSAAGACVKRIMGPGPRCSEFTISRPMAPWTCDSMPTRTRRKTQFFMRMRPDGSATAAGRWADAYCQTTAALNSGLPTRPIERSSPRNRTGRPASGAVPGRLIADRSPIRTLFGHEVDVLERYPIGLDLKPFGRNDHPRPSALRRTRCPGFNCSDSPRTGRSVGKRGSSGAGSVDVLEQGAGCGEAGQADSHRKTQRE